MTNSGYDAPADALFEKLNWPNIVEIIKQETAAMVYKSLHGLPRPIIFSRNSTRDTVYLRNSVTDLQVSLFIPAKGRTHLHIAGLISGTP